jgi:SAM-dependent methyltransferase
VPLLAPDTLDRVDHRRVLDVLRDAGYTDAGIVEVVGEGVSKLGRRRVPPLLRRTAGGSPRETLIRLFIVGVAVPAGAAAAALAPMTVEEWGQIGLLEVSGPDVRATVQLRRFQELVVAFDFGRPAAGNGLAPDYVMGVSPSTISLAAHTIRHPCRTTLDLGTGSGFHALVAAAHSERVIATDRNPRAVEITAFNAALNGLANVEARAGDLFEPVEGEAFDLVVSNPPFIISPDFKHLFLTTELKGDELCQRLAREAPAHLVEGGWCQFLANWAVLEDQPWDARLATWFDGGGCDVWVNRKTTLRPDDYAALWIETEDDDVDEFSRFFDTWMAYYEEQSIEAVGFGLVTMRKRTGGHPNWFWADDVPDAAKWAAGDDVERCMLLHDFLEAIDDHELLEQVVRLAPDARLERECVAEEGRWQTSAARVFRRTGLGYSGSIDEFGAELLASCTAGRPVRDVVAAVADQLGQPTDAVVQPALANVRSLIGRAILLPAVVDAAPVSRS